MEQKGTKDWSKEASRQISVYKTDKGLIELYDSLKPSSRLFPAHIHATGQKQENGERSLVRLTMLDYSNGTGDNTVSVYANISPEEAKYIYSAVYNHLVDFEFLQDKIFGVPDAQGFSIVTRLQIIRYDTDAQGKRRGYPWLIEIQNGRGIAAKNSNGGKYCKKGSYICDRKARLFLSDRDMFVLFCKAEAYILAFEQEHAFKQNRISDFTNLYKLLAVQLQKVMNGQSEMAGKVIALEREGKRSRMAG